MGADERIEQFEKWSRGRGLVARDVDRRRIAGELFEIAGRSSVSQEHIEQLIKRYRDGLVGANKVLLARRVAEEILSWQEEGGGTSGAAVSSPPPKASEPPPEPRVERREKEKRDKPRIASLDDFSLPTDLDSLRAPPPPGAKKISSIPPDRTSARPPPKPDPSELDGFEADFSSPAKSLLSASVPAPKRRVRSDEDGEDLGGSWLEPDEGAGRSSRPARAISEAPIGHASARPRASVRAAPEAGESKRPVPLLESEFSLDDAPKRYQTGRSKPPSVPPPAGSLPDVISDERGVSPERRRRSDDISDSVAPPPAVGPVRGYPLGEVVSDDRRFRVTDYVSAKVLIGAGGALFIALLLTTVILRPAFLFGDSHKLVTGRVQIQNLGASIEFRDPWYHSEDLDDDETQGKWVRHVSQFYRGGSDFQTAGTKLTFVVFDSKKAMVNDEEVRQLGTNETLNAAQRRRCEPFEYEGKKGTQCTALAGQFGRTYGVVETWYPDSGKAIFSRAMIEMPMMGMAGGGDPQQMADNQASFERELIAAFVEIEKVVFSFQLTRK